LNLTTLFDLSLIGRATRPGLEFDDGTGQLVTLTFGEIEARANRMARELAARGLEAGDRLCGHLPNRVEFIDLFLACTRLGVIFVPMNVLYRERELRHIIGDASPKSIVVAATSDTTYPDGVDVWTVEALAESAATRPATRLSVPLDGDTPAVIIYTS
jgi:acyl-CoA synthetase (AMP-forming)/AMP-acid ligase II